MTMTPMTVTYFCHRWLESVIFIINIFIIIFLIIILFFHLSRPLKKINTPTVIGVIVIGVIE